jgi:hypothetical protein
MGRPPLPPGQKRDALIRFKVRSAAKEEFEKVARDNGYTPSKAGREAFADWIHKMRGKR